jgi:hypothetical protein
MLATIPCPSCKVNLKTPGKLLGKTIHCPKCKKPVKLVVRNDNPAEPAATWPEKEPAPPPPVDEKADMPAEPDWAVDSVVSEDVIEQAAEETIEDEVLEEEGVEEGVTDKAAASATRSASKGRSLRALWAAFRNRFSLSKIFGKRITKTRKDENTKE